MNKKTKYAGVVELADTPDLGSGVPDVQVQVLSPAPYRVFITDLSYGHSIFLQFRVSSLCMEQVLRPALLFYADLVIYSTATPFRVSAL